MAVAVVIPTYNRKDILRGCLTAVTRQSVVPDEVIVVDNGSTDGTARMVQADFPGVRLVRLAENSGGAGGFAKGMAFACQRCHDWLWLMDDDAVPDKDALCLLLRAAQSTAVWASVDISRGLVTHGWWKGKEVYATVSLGDLLSELNPIAVDFVPFPGMLIHRRAIQLVGLPIADFFIDDDDTEYCLRLRKAGVPIYVIPSSVIRGQEPRASSVPGTQRGLAAMRLRKRSRAKRPAWRAYYITRNRVFMITRLHRSATGLLHLVEFLLGAAAGDLLYEDDGCYRVGLRFSGIIDGLRGKLGKRPGLPP